MYLRKCPEPAVVDFDWIDLYFSGIYRIECVYHLAFLIRFEDISKHMYRNEMRDSQLFANFSCQRFFDGLPVIDMTAYGRIPFAGLNVFIRLSLLKIQLPVVIYNM